MISFVVWKWWDPRVRRRFESTHVNVLRASIRRHYPAPHRFICITDHPQGLDASIEVVPMPVTGFEHLINPSEHEHRARMPASGKCFPSCYRRLWNFSREAAALLGARIFALDIDVIVCGDLRPLVERYTASFVGWCDQRFEWNKVAGGAYLLTTGAHPQVWEQFHPERSPSLAQQAGNGGSDQAWMSYQLFPPPMAWQRSDGLTKLKWLRGAAQPPAGTRLVFTSGETPPWSPDTQRGYPWIRDYWRGD